MMTQRKTLRMDSSCGQILAIQIHQKYRMAKIFKGDSPFDDGGTLEVLEGFPEGADTPLFPESPQEFSPGLDTELKKMVQQAQRAG
jgi:hypothetical protein